MDNLDDDDDVVVGGGDESDIDIPIPITDFSFENSDRASDDESNDSADNLDDGDVSPVTEAVRTGVWLDDTSRVQVEDFTEDILDLRGMDSKKLLTLPTISH